MFIVCDMFVAADMSAAVNGAEAESAVRVY